MLIDFFRDFVKLLSFFDYKIIEKFELGKDTKKGLWIRTGFNADMDPDTVKNDTCDQDTLLWIKVIKNRIFQHV